jgi:RHS repeat-associated protein
VYGRGPHGGTEYYAYDNADRITAACYGGQVATCASGSKITYAYDKVGNRTSQTKFGTTTSYSYDAGDELTSTTTGGTTTTYTYDNDGQQTAQGTKTFAYDLAGHLTQAANSGTTLASFTYDGNDNRLTKTANSVTTSYAWDENNDLPMLATEKQGSTVLRDYAYGDQLLQMNAAGASFYYHHDNLGSVAAITKSTGATEWTYTYTPYGEPRQTTKVDPNAPNNPIQYTSELLDSETALYDLRARIYNPEDGRFLSLDPLPESPGDPAIGDYVYVADAPTTATDPSGQMPQMDCSNDLRDAWDPCGVKTLRLIHISQAVEWLDAHGRHEEANRVWAGPDDGGLHLGRLIKRGVRAAVNVTASFVKDHWRSAASIVATVAAGAAGFTVGMAVCGPGCAAAVSMAAAGAASRAMAKLVNHASTRQAVATGLISMSTGYVVRVQVFAITGKTPFKLVVSVVRKK